MPKERYITPSADERCGVPKDACRCMKRKGHDGLHACAHGEWRALPPGKHPETRQLREALARAEEYDDGVPWAAAYIAHMRRELARFDARRDQRFL